MESGAFAFAIIGPRGPTLTGNGSASKKMAYVGQVQKGKVD